MKREIWKCRCGQNNLGPGNICPNCRDIRTSKVHAYIEAVPPEATNSCATDAVEASRKEEE